MNPEAVPTELVEKAARAMPTAAPDSVAREVVRLILAAVLPEIQAQAWDEGKAVGYSGPFPEDIANPYRAASPTTFVFSAIGREITNHQTAAEPESEGYRETLPPTPDPALEDTDEGGS